MMRLGRPYQDQGPGRRPWSSIMTIGAISLVLAALEVVVNRDRHVSLWRDSALWCMQAACQPAGPGLAELALAADPTAWRRVFGDRAPGAAPGTNVDETAPAHALPGRLVFWDHGGRPFAATRIAVATTARTQPDGIPATQW
ncbi:MAG TPA: hypothetical protein VGJ87_23445, partial [Roseiflexaceae bacterium]